MSFMDRIEECRRFDPRRYRELRVGKIEIGMLTDALADRLREFPTVFTVADDHVRVAERLGDFASRTDAVAEVLQRMRENGEVPHWRDEPYPVAPAFAAPPLFNMERAAVPMFGVRGYGVHMNGLVSANGTLRMWIGKRSLTKPTGPGKLDQLVAGGQPAGISLRDNLTKECAEEAAIPSELAAKAVPIGAVSYVTERSEGLRRDVLFNYDLELPPDFEPRNTDGEIDSFYLWPIGRVIETVRDSDAFKFNCALVVIDFLIRRGLIEPDHPEYVELLWGLHG